MTGGHFKFIAFISSLFTNFKSEISESSCHGLYVVTFINQGKVNILKGMYKETWQIPCIQTYWEFFEEGHHAVLLVPDEVVHRFHVSLLWLGQIGQFN